MSKVGAVLVVGGGIDVLKNETTKDITRRDIANDRNKVGSVLVVGGGIDIIRIWHAFSLFCRDACYHEHGCDTS